MAVGAFERNRLCGRVRLIRHPVGSDLVSAAFDSGLWSVLSGAWLPALSEKTPGTGTARSGRCTLRGISSAGGQSDRDLFICVQRKSRIVTVQPDILQKR